MEHREKDRIGSGIYGGAAGESAENSPQEPVPAKSDLEEQIYGTRETKPRRRMKRSTFIVTIALLAALVCGAAAGGFYLHDRNVKTAQYLKDARIFYEMADASYFNLEIFGSLFCSNWSMYVNDRILKLYKDPDDVYEKTKDSFGIALDTPKKYKGEQDSLADKLKQPYISKREELDKLAASVQAVNQSLNQFYDILIAPKGSYNTYVPDYEKKRDETKKELLNLNKLQNDLGVQDTQSGT